jgi:acyl carrier protein
MNPKIFLDNYLILKVGKNKFKHIIDLDLIAEGIIDSLDIVTLSTTIKKKFKIDLNFNNSNSVDLFRSYKKILNKINENR